MSHIGIDFGAKRSGKTVACFKDQGQWQVLQSKKDQDADAFIENIVEAHLFKSIFIDAPLTLPSVYTGKKGSDYFYREADREANAMSPMFLGGLTARAIRLRDTWRAKGLAVYEAYPAGLVRELDLKIAYKKDLSAFLAILREKINQDLPPVANWHQADALLAWVTGKRTLEKEHRTLGNEEEGLIFI